MTARTVGTEAGRVEGSAEFGLVLGMTRQIAQLVHPVRELTLVAVLAAATLFKRPAQLRLVATGVGLIPPASLFGRLADAAVEFLVFRFEDDIVDAEGEADVRVVELCVLSSGQETGSNRCIAVARQHRWKVEGDGVLTFQRRSSDGSEDGRSGGLGGGSRLWQGQHRWGVRRWKRRAWRCVWSRNTVRTEDQDCDYYPRFGTRLTTTARIRDQRCNAVIRTTEDAAEKIGGFRFLANKAVSRDLPTH